MSLEKDITGVKHNLDEDVFKSATDEDLKDRKTKLQQETEKKAKARQLERERKEKQWEEINHMKIDTCPHCGADLRADEDMEDTVYALETTYSTQGKHWKNGEWFWGEGDTEDPEITGWRCGYCGDDLIEGEDFDISL